MVGRPGALARTAGFPGAAMEPTSEWSGDFAPPATADANIWPQWSRPVNGRETTLPRSIGPYLVRPQWSRPVNGRETPRHRKQRCAPDRAAMEPTSEWSGASALSETVDL